jgi:hypothetical protein
MMLFDRYHIVADGCMPSLGRVELRVFESECIERVAQWALLISNKMKIIHSRTNKCAGAPQYRTHALRGHTPGVREPWFFYNLKQT